MQLKGMLSLRYVGIFILAGCALGTGRAQAADYTGEKIVYAIGTRGTAVYNDKGIVDLGGKRAKLVTFKTDTLGLHDIEKIFVDVDTQFPVRVERTVSFLLRKEYLVEEYSQVSRTLEIKKYVHHRLVKEYRFASDGPIHNAVLLPFYLRSVKDLEPGWSFVTRFPRAYTVTLASIEEVRVPAGTFKAYHFVSDPRKFEIWISTGQERIPLKIKGSGAHSYTLAMKSRSFDAR